VFRCLSAFGISPQSSLVREFQTLPSLPSLLLGLSVVLILGCQNILLFQLENPCITTVVNYHFLSPSNCSCFVLSARHTTSHHVGHPHYQLSSINLEKERLIVKTTKQRHELFWVTSSSSKYTELFSSCSMHPGQSAYVMLGERHGSRGQPWRVRGVLRSTQSGKT
jgi:hypothetical protein